MVSIALEIVSELLKDFISVDPLFVFAFLQIFIETLTDYLGELSVESLKESFDVVYQVCK